MLVTGIWFLTIGSKIEGSSLPKAKKASEDYKDCTQRFIDAAERKRTFQFEYQYKTKWHHYFLKPEKKSRNIYKPKVAYLDPGPNLQYHDSLSNYYCWVMKKCNKRGGNDPSVCISSYSEKYNNFYWYNNQAEKGPFLKEVLQKNAEKLHTPKYQFKIYCEDLESNSSACENPDYKKCDIRNVIDMDDAAYVARSYWVYMKGKCITFSRLVPIGSKLLKLIKLSSI